MGENCDPYAYHEVVFGFDCQERPRGSIEATFSVWCGTCDNTLDCESARRKDVRGEAIGQGWQYTRAFGWVCPECAVRLPMPEERYLFDKHDWEKWDYYNG